MAWTYPVLMEPKWNVKSEEEKEKELCDLVLMEPKWNVKRVVCECMDATSETGINGTKVECKGRSKN